MDEAWLRARIAVARAIIEAYETAILSLSSGEVQSFTLDTGQTRQTVTKKDLARLGAALGDAENRLAYLEKRLYGDGLQGRPAW